MALFKKNDRHLKAQFIIESNHDVMMAEIIKELTSISDTSIISSKEVLL